MSSNLDQVLQSSSLSEISEAFPGRVKNRYSYIQTREGLILSVWCCYGGYFDFYLSSKPGETSAAAQ